MVAERRIAFPVVLGALALVVAVVVDLGLHAWLALLPDRHQFGNEGPGLDPMDVWRLLMSSFASLDFIDRAVVFVGFGVAALRASPTRVWCAVAALGGALALPSTVLWLGVFGIEPGGLEPYQWLGAAGRVLTFVGIVAVVAAASRDDKKRRLALALACVHVLAVFPYFVGLIDGLRAALGPWWADARWAGMRPSVWFFAVGTLTGAIALLVVGRDQADRSAGSALRGAAAVVWLRAALAVFSVVLAILALRAAVKSAQAPGGEEASWVLETAPMIGHVEALLGVSLVVLFGGLFFQCRDFMPKLLILPAMTLMLGAVTVTAGLNIGLMESLPSTDRGSWVGAGLANQIEFARKIDPYIRVGGYMGMLLAVISLVRLAGTLELPDARRRGLRFAAFSAFAVVLFLTIDKWLPAMGMLTLLLLPVILTAAVWLLLDLTHLLSEVGGALAKDSDRDDADAISADAPGER